MTAVQTLDHVADAPGRTFGLGHLLSMSRDLPSLLRAVAAEAEPLRRLRMPFGSDIYLWASTEALGLLSHKEVSASETAAIGEVIVGHTSMLSSDGADHRRRRTSSSAPFSPKGLSMSGVSDVIAEVVHARVAAMVERGELQMLDETQSLSLEILFRVMGVPRDELDQWAARYNDMIRGVLGPSWNIPGLPHHRALRARAWVDERLGRYVEAARQDDSSTGLVAELVRGRDEDGSGLDEIELFDNLRLLVLAGHETTASVMAWMVAYLAQSPELHERLLEEARASDHLPRTPRELLDYPLAEAFFRECLRLHPPAVVATRKTLAPMTVEGVEVPVGTLLGIPLWLFSRDPGTFPEPDRFDPDRWIREKRRLTPLEQSAFGGGPHFCLGYHMALVEAVQFIVALLRAMNEASVVPHMAGLPGESYLPLLRPRAKETRCRFVAR